MRNRLPDQISLPFLTAPPGVALTDDVSNLLAKNCVVAVGVSGGKDSAAVALAVNDYLNQIAHTGPRVLIHADLGAVEWQDSLPSCQRLAACLGWELIVVRRQAGDMLDRWYGRWANNVVRYAELSCVKVILPWSTPSMRFCTSELKEAIIASALKKRFPNSDILNVTGIRRQESDARRKKPVSAPQKKLQRKGCTGVTWNAIIEWTIEQVFRRIDEADLLLHEAYTRYNSSRVSCVFCIMSSWPDLLAAVSCLDNREVYLRMVELEARSTFAFQGSRWLADVAPNLLPADLAARIDDAKRRSIERQRIESAIPEHLLYTSGWPTIMPTYAEAELLASVRSQMSTLMNLKMRCLTAETVMDRYEFLLAERLRKEEHKKSRSSKNRDLSLKRAA